MPTIENVSQLYETGNKKFFAASVTEDGSFGEKEYHEGLMEVAIEFKSENVLKSHFVKNISQGIKILFMRNIEFQVEIEI